MGIIIQNKIKIFKEELFNNILSRFKIPVAVIISPKEKIIDGAEGCFESDVIKINEHLPLFHQLIVLEHEIGHYHAMVNKKAYLRRTFKIYRKYDDIYEKEELKAWKWVEMHPMKKQGIVDQEIKKYIKKISSFIKENPEEEELCLHKAFWF